MSEAFAVHAVAALNYIFQIFFDSILAESLDKKLCRKDSRESSA